MRGIFTLLMVWVLASASPCMAEDDIYLNEDVTSNDGFVIADPDYYEAPPIPISPLEGTFVLVKTLPEVDLNARELDQTLFLPEQKVSFKYLYGMGKSYGEWYGQQAYTMTLHPPFHMAMCRQKRWSAECQNDGTYIPFENIEYKIMLLTQDIDDYDAKYVLPLLRPVGLDLGEHHYGATFADKGGAYGFYFNGKDTLINHTYHRIYEDASSKPRIINVMQILKRVKN